MAGYRATGGMASRAHQEGTTDPEPEKVAGTVFPYRGMESHGVAPTQTPPEYIDDQWPADDEAPHYVQGPTEDDPLPVKVVNEYSRELRIIRPIPFLVTDKPKPILGRNECRRDLRIRNSSTSTTVSNLSGVDRVTTQTGLTGSGNTAEYVIPATGWDQLSFGQNITTLTGTTPGVTIKIQETLDGTNWVDLITFTAATAPTYELKKTIVGSGGAPSNRIRVVWTTTGTVTNLSFTIDVMRFPVVQGVTVGGGNNVYIGENSVAPSNGYLIPPGGEVYPINTEEEIWAVCETGKESTIYLLAELVVGQ